VVDFKTPLTTTDFYKELTMEEKISTIVPIILIVVGFGGWIIISILEYFGII
jgi:hypothetical protein